MTGFGRGTAEEGNLRVVAELRSVNGRFLDLRMKLPRVLLQQEAAAREFLQRQLSRGTVEVMVQVEALHKKSDGLVDRELAGLYAQVSRELARNLGLDDGLTASSVLRFPGVLVESEAALVGREEALGALFLQALDRAAHEMIGAREAEGARLLRHIGEEIDRLDAHRGNVLSFRDEANETLRRKMESRVAEYSAVKVAVDPQRLAQEILFLLQRSDVSEEMERLQSHIEAARKAVAAGGALGKRLEFLGQEMGREVNTLGSKSDHSDISTAVVEMKLILERIREQVQNLE